MRSVVVFGGSGFIGSHLVTQLSKRGVTEITIADIREPTTSLPQGAKFVHSDVREPISIVGSIQPDTAIDLAAIAREPGYPDEDYYDTNVGGARNIVAYCEKAGTRTIWFTSSMSVYGPSETPCVEQTEPRPETPYGKSKLQAEQVYTSWLERGTGKRLRIVRPAVIFGARENGNFTKLANALRRGFFFYPGRTDTVKACGYVEDLVESMFFMHAQEGRLLRYNYCYPKTYTIKDICDTFVRVAGFRPPLGTIPLPLMLAGARVFQLLNSLGWENGIHPMRIYKLVRSTNIYPEELLKRGYVFNSELDDGLRRWLRDEPQGEFV